MGILRDRLNSKLRTRRAPKDIPTPLVDTTISTQPPPPPPLDTDPPLRVTPLPTPPLPTPPTSLPRLSTPIVPSASSTRTTSTLQDTSTKFRRLLRTRARAPSRASASSAPLDDVPDPEPRLLPANPTSTQELPPDTPLTDGYVSLVVPPGWRAMRAADAIYLLSEVGVGFVKSVRAPDACAVLVDVSRVSVMSQVLVRSSPVWEGCEARVHYDIVGGFGIGVARFEQGFDGGAVVFAICASYDRRQIVMDALESIRRSAKVVKVPDGNDNDAQGGDKESETEGKGIKGHNSDGGGEKSEAGCAVQ